MRLFEAILDANHRALAGDASAGIHPSDFADALPVAALTCIDARLNPLFPSVLGLPKENFIWLRNAGNIITGPISSTMRSLALACVVKGAKEIAIIGHTDCLVSKSSVMKLMDGFKALGVDRASLPENLTEFFGLFASERQNVIKAVEFVRHSPIIGPRIPVHGLMVDITTGSLEWVVNGYQAIELSVQRNSLQNSGAWAGEAIGALKAMAEFKLGEMKFPDTKIGELASAARDVAIREIEKMATPAAAAPPPPPTIAEQVQARIPLPPRLRPGPTVRRKSY